MHCSLISVQLRTTFDYREVYFAFLALKLVMNGTFWIAMNIHLRTDHNQNTMMLIDTCLTKSFFNKQTRYKFYKL